MAEKYAPKEWWITAQCTTFFRFVIWNVLFDTTYVLSMIQAIIHIYCERRGHKCHRERAENQAMAEMEPWSILCPIDKGWADTVVFYYKSESTSHIGIMPEILTLQDFQSRSINQSPRPSWEIRLRFQSSTPALMEQLEIPHKRPRWSLHSLPLDAPRGLSCKANCNQWYRVGHSPWRTDRASWIGPKAYPTKWCRCSRGRKGEWSVYGIHSRWVIVNWLRKELTIVPLRRWSPTLWWS